MKLLGHRVQGAGKIGFSESIFYYRQYSRFVIAWATIFCFYCPASFSLHLAFFSFARHFFCLHEFIRSFHTNLLPLFCPRIVVSFSSWKRNQNKNTLKKLVNSDFKICETIICLQMKIPGIEKLIPEYGKALMMVTRPVKKNLFLQA